MTTNNHLNNFIEIDSKIHEDIQTVVEDLLEVNHLDLENTKYLAKALFSLGRYGESIRQFERALSMKSNDKDAIANIGINHFYRKDYKTAMKYFDEAIEMDPSNESLLIYKMLSHEFLSEYDNAIMCGEKIL